MASIVISLGGVAIKQPTDLSIEKFNLTKSGRVASGKMKIELIAKKRKFTFTYDAISGSNMQIILGVIDTTVMFFPLVYNENGIQNSAIVYVGAIKSKRFRTDGVMHWKNFTFDLIEQ